MNAEGLVLAGGFRGSVPRSTRLSGGLLEARGAAALNTAGPSNQTSKETADDR